MNKDDLLRLIYRLQWCLMNHAPVPELFDMRQKVLKEAYELTKFMDVPYGLPDCED